MTPDNTRKNIMLNQARFVLAVTGLKVSVPFYRDQLGMDVEFEEGGWCFLSRDNFSLMLGECPDAIAPKALGDHSYFAYITVTDATALFEEFNSKLVEIMKPLTDEPWGMREFGIVSVDGHRIMFGEELDSNQDVSLNS
ncbi:VOC family protein [Undibacterium curvum]|uniref:VOC family protein n=1 Tax=Undibacterium curvum TaxID=2762294 RepID=UPI003D1166A9